MELFILLVCILGFFVTWKHTQRQRLINDAKELLRMGVPMQAVGPMLEIRNLFHKIPKEKRAEAFKGLMERRCHLTEEQVRKLIRYYD